MKERMTFFAALLLFASSPATVASYANYQEGKMNPKEFLSFVTAGDVAKIIELLKSDPSLVRATDDKGVSAILLATYYRKQAIVDLLLATGTELNIFEAAATGRTERVRVLLRKDPTLVNAFAPDGFYPLGLAVFFGHKDAAAVLLDAGAEINMAARNPMKVMALHAAAASRQVEIARRLIEGGADVNARQQSGFGALHEVASSGQIEFAQLLIAHGADVNAKTEDGKTPLSLALASHQDKMAELLRKLGGKE